MKTTIGGDRLGSGQKENISARKYERSTHELDGLWRSSMASGTLVPFMSEVALPGDSFDIELQCEVLTLPTIGPLFGSYKVQLDVFQVPIRLYNAGLHMNRLGIGMDMSSVFLPRMKLVTCNHADYQQTYEDNEQVNESCIFKYLGIAGLGDFTASADPARRYFNAVPYLAYWDIYKNYYSNKQEERGFVIHTDTGADLNIDEANLYQGGEFIQDILGVAQQTAINGDENTSILIKFPDGSLEPNTDEIRINVNGTSYWAHELFDNIFWLNNTVWCTEYNELNVSLVNWYVQDIAIPPAGGIGAQIRLQEFDLNNIDDMREDILQYPFNSGVFTVDENSPEPYSLPMEGFGAGAQKKYGLQFTQEGLGLKTYQSDLFNNWISTEWIDGTGGINEITAVSTAGDSFSIDALNLAQKVYNMLNRVAISGGTYDDWLDAVYTHERSKSIESPVYHGSLIKELAFQEVVSNAESGSEPLGTLAGRGQLTQKHKGGKMIIKVHEPSYIMGIASITPRIDYSQGNKWDMNLETLNDLHKPALDAIGYQDLITDQMLWTDTKVVSSTGVKTYKSAGKQPAWINYMTEVNRVYGNFANRNKDMFMTLNRRYENSGTSGAITDLTTYIDPTKFNHIFAQTELDAQNFWVQISKKITARRKMSAKVIPNL
jgi:hypothetical protein